VRDRWLGNNIDLNLLSQAVKQFFTERQFETSLQKTQKGHKIEANTEKILNTQLTITVEIFGETNDFTIEFTAGKKRKGFLSPSMVFGYVASVLGGGSFLLSEVNLRETLEKLEKKFWNHVDEQVAKLTNSAKKDINKL